MYTWIQSSNCIPRHLQLSHQLKLIELLFELQLMTLCSFASKLSTVDSILSHFSGSCLPHKVFKRSRHPEDFRRPWARGVRLWPPNSVYPEEQSDKGTVEIQSLCPFFHNDSNWFRITILLLFGVCRFMCIESVSSAVAPEVQLYLLLSFVHLLHSTLDVHMGCS